MLAQKVAITGFMCSGKTTVARALGQLLGCNVIDLDEAIRISEGLTAGQIIEQNGENAFRESETRVLTRLLSRQDGSVISLGGGTWTLEENRRLLAEHRYRTVWLDAPFELCWKRIEEQAGTRPLADSYEVAKQLYQDRLNVYELSHFRYAVTGVNTSEEIARGIDALVFRDRENS